MFSMVFLVDLISLVGPTFSVKKVDAVARLRRFNELNLLFLSVLKI